MRSQTLTKCVVLQGLIGVLAVGTARADAKWYDAVALSGYAQTSYVGNLNTPTDGSGAKVDNVGRQFDTDSNGFNFNAFLLQIAKPVGDDRYGFTTRLRMGQDSTVINGSTSASFLVQEGYLTYAATSKLSLIGGKFVTPLGFEVVDTVSNPNFSEGLLFTYAEPITHTGVKANYVFSDKVNATIGVVNGWDVAKDNNTAKTLLWQLATTPAKGFAWYFQGLYGKENADPSHSSRLTFDTVATLALMDKLSLAAQAIWGQQTNDSNTGGTTHWSGLGAWVTFAETAKTSTSLRFEVLSDQNDANRFSASTFSDGTTRQTVKDITVTQKYMLTANMGVRGEYRHDWSNQAYFTRNTGGKVKNQNTVSADWFVTF